MEILSIVLLIITALLVHFLYKNILKPYLLLKFYVKQFAQKKYSACVYKYIPLASEVFIKMLADEKNNHDSFLSFKECQNCDVLLTNYSNKILIYLQNPQLIK